MSTAGVIAALTVMQMNRGGQFMLCSMFDNVPATPPMPAPVIYRHPPCGHEYPIEEVMKLQICTNCGTEFDGLRRVSLPLPVIESNKVIKPKTLFQRLFRN